MSRARAGDQDAFAALVEPYRAELLVHCYRMLGSLQDAEDALQETLLSAWLGLDGFEGRVVGAHLALPHRHQPLPQPVRVRRPATGRPGPCRRPPSRPGSGEVPWLQPYPDVLLDLPDQRPGPRPVESREAISLAFVTAAPAAAAEPAGRAAPARRARLPRPEAAELLGTTGRR